MHRFQPDPLTDEALHRLDPRGYQLFTSPSWVPHNITHHQRGELREICIGKEIGFATFVGKAGTNGKRRSLAEGFNLSRPGDFTFGHHGELAAHHSLDRDELELDVFKSTCRRREDPCLVGAKGNQAHMLLGLHSFEVRGMSASKCISRAPTLNVMRQRKIEVNCGFSSASAGVGSPSVLCWGDLKRKLHRN